MAGPGGGVEGSNEEHPGPEAAPEPPVSPAEGEPDERRNARTSRDGGRRSTGARVVGAGLVAAVVVVAVLVAGPPLPPWVTLAALALVLALVFALARTAGSDAGGPEPHAPSPTEGPGSADRVGSASEPGPSPRTLERVQVDGRGGRRVVEMRDVLWVEASRNYVRLHLEGRSYLYRRPLGELERELEELDFLRVHRSAMVCLRAVERVEPLPSGDAVLHLRTGAAVRMSRRYAPAFHARTGRR